MSGEIFIEASGATSFGITVPVAQHLYLVYRGETGDEYVLRAGPENGFWPFGELRIEVNVAMEDSVDRRGSESPEDRASTPLDFGPLTDDQAWGLMVRYAAWIEETGVDYRLFAENSNAFIGALLFAAGGSPEDMLPTGVGPGEAVGFLEWDDIVDEIAPPGDWILRGTPDADVLVGIQIDDEILGLGGRDRIDGGDGDDAIRAGSGDDRVRGQAGDDLLVGNGGRDVLRGGTGDDTLNGGVGDDVLVGGRGADVFVFRKARPGEVDTIVDFNPAEDRLDLPEPPGEIRGTEGAVELVWEDRTIRITEVTEDQLAATGLTPV